MTQPTGEKETPKPSEQTETAKTTETTEKTADQLLEERFKLGYRHGQEKGKKDLQKEIAAKLAEYGIDFANLEQSLGSLKKEVPDDAEKNVLEAIKKELAKEKDSKRKLAEDFETEKRKFMIDGKLSELAAKNSAFDPEIAAEAFKKSYDIELQGGRIVIKNKSDGLPKINEHGYLTLDDVYGQFIKDKGYLFKAPSSGVNIDTKGKATTIDIERIKAGDAKYIRDNRAAYMDAVKNGLL